MKTILFNPFKRFRETILLAFGVAATIIGSVLAAIFDAHYDNILHISYAMESTFYHPFLENIINIAVLVVLLYAVGLYLNRKTRFVDILATCLVARTPYYILPLFNINHFMVRVGNQMMYNLTHHTKTLQLHATVPLIVSGVISTLAVIWYIVLLYQGFKVDSNARGILANTLFVIAIILGVVASKYLITLV